MTFRSTQFLFLSLFLLFSDIAFAHSLAARCIRASYTPKTKFSQSNARKFVATKAEYHSFIGEDAYRVNFMLYRGDAKRHAKSKSAKLEKYEEDILLVTGRGELSEGDYARQVMHLREIGHTGDIWILDHRGQGFSERIVGKNHALGHVRDFKNYEKDILRMIKIIKINNGDRPINIYSHSMGSQVVFRASLRDPEMFDQTTITADGPMMRINMGVATVVVELLSPFLVALDRASNGVLPFSGKIGVGVRKQKPFRLDPEAELSTSKEIKVLREDWHINPVNVSATMSHVSATGKTIEWAYEAIWATLKTWLTSYLVKLGFQEYKIPTLLMAYKNDSIVQTGRAAAILRRLGTKEENILIFNSDKTLHSVNQAGRADYLESLFKWYYDFLKNSPSRPTRDAMTFEPATKTPKVEIFNGPM